MNRETSVRLATPADAEAVAGLFDQYRQFYKQPPGVDACLEFVRARLESGDSHILLAVGPSGEPAGFTQLYPIYSSVRMRRIWILNDLFVAPGFRGSGVATALMESAASLARERGVAGLQLETAADNRPAKQLYEKLGWSMDTEFHHYSIIL